MPPIDLVPPAAAAARAIDSPTRRCCTAWPGPGPPTRLLLPRPGNFEFGKARGGAEEWHAGAVVDWCPRRGIGPPQPGPAELSHSRWGGWTVAELLLPPLRFPAGPGRVTRCGIILVYLPKQKKTNGPLAPTRMLTRWFNPHMPQHG
jgi:hypothetical protein